MASDKKSNSQLPMNTLSDIPSPRPDAKNIVAVVKHSGKVAGYKLSDGRVIDKAEGVSLAKQGEINGVGVSKRGGKEYIKSIPDGSENNNLGSLPTMTD